MKARRPSIDFARAPAGWIPDAPGYAYQLWNWAGVIGVCLAAFLVGFLADLIFCR